MHIEKLYIKGFGRISNLTLDLNKGLNLVYGLNESGKTTIQWFIKGMFFGLKGGRAAKDGELPPLRKYKPWYGIDYGGTIEYRLDSGALYRIERDFESGDVHIYDDLFKKISSDEKNVVLGDLCFEKVGFIKQMQSKVDESSKKELLSKISNVMQTGFEDISFDKAEKVLRDAIKTHVGSDRTTTRPMDMVVSRLEELKKSRDVIQKKREEIKEAYQNLEIERNIKGNAEKRKDILAIMEKLNRKVKTYKLGTIALPIISVILIIIDLFIKSPICKGIYITSLLIAILSGYMANKTSNKIKYKDGQEILADQKIIEYEILLRNSRCEEDELQIIDEEIEELIYKKACLESLDFSLRTALETLIEASTEIQKDYIPILNSKMSSIIDRMSNGRYYNLKADDKLSIRTESPETGKVTSAHILSGGTIDQIYLSLRLSMAEIIENSGEKMPFIMDEVFAQYDDTRTANSLRLLEELSEERQIILFTCKGREVEIASKVCDGGLNLIRV